MKNYSFTKKGPGRCHRQGDGVIKIGKSVIMGRFPGAKILRKAIAGRT